MAAVTQHLKLIVRLDLLKQNEQALKQLKGLLSVHSNMHPVQLHLPLPNFNILALLSRLSLLTFTEKAFDAALIS